MTRTSMYDTLSEGKHTNNNILVDHFGFHPDKHALDHADPIDPYGRNDLDHSDPIDPTRPMYVKDPSRTDPIW